MADILKEFGVLTPAPCILTPVIHFVAAALRRSEDL